MFDLDWLLDPFGKKTFFDEIWQKRPQLLVRMQPGRFDGLFGRREVERIIEFGQPRPPSIRLASAANQEKVEVPFLSNGRINIDRIRKLYGSGQTIILNSVEDFDPSVAQLARSIETEMGARVQVNSYLTPPAAQGFKAHYDTHDVLVVQIEGKKLWKVYGADSACPLNEMVNGDPRISSSAQPPEELLLSAGDVLYIPRGWVHEASTHESASLHLTLGLHPPLGKDLLISAVEGLVAKHRELREALPIGALTDPRNRAALEARFARLVALLSAGASALGAAEAIDEQMLQRGRSGGDGRLFEDVVQLGGLTRETVLQRRTNMPCRVIEEDQAVTLRFSNGVIRGPSALGAAMDFVVSRKEPFSVADLPGLSEDHQLLVASSLVADGLCYLQKVAA
ncbi:MAG: cupin domain-containing protein [Devosia sp.]